MQFAFDTKRLRVFKSRIIPTDHNAARDVFIAFRTDEDRPMVCATAMVFGVYDDLLVDWIEVTSEYRRQGFASELAKAIEAHYGKPLAMEGGSESGDGFCEAFRARREKQP